MTNRSQHVDELLFESVETTVRVGCSVESTQHRAWIRDELAGHQGVVVSMVKPDSIAAGRFDLSVLDPAAFSELDSRLAFGVDSPVLIVGGDWEQVAAAELVDEACVDFVASPVEETALRGRLRMVVRLRQHALASNAMTGHHRALVELLPEAVLIVVDGEIRYANAAAGCLFESSADTLAGSTFVDLLAAADREAASELLVAAQQVQTTEFVEFEAVVDGESVDIEVAATAVDPESGIVQLVCRDLTGRDHREAQLRLYEKVLEEASLGITITDARAHDNPLVYVNPEFERLSGLDSEQLLGTNPRILQTDTTDPKTVTAVRAAVEAGEAISVELRNRRKDGTEWHNALDVSPVYHDGELTHFLGFQRDVTNKRHRQNQIAVLDRVLRHNLRNRLNVIMGHAETLSEGASTEAVPIHATTICETADELLSLSEKTRQFRAALEVDTDTDEPTAVDEILTESLQRLRKSRPDAAIDSETTETVHIYAGRVVRFVLTELLTNAVDHSEQEPPTVTVRTSVEEGILEIEITDNGPGIPEAERQAFDDATETPTDHAIGIGLWLVQWALDSAGGGLDYDAVEPRGSRLTVRLPTISD